MRWVPFRMAVGAAVIEVLPRGEGRSSETDGPFGADFPAPLKFLWILVLLQGNCVLTASAKQLLHKCGDIQNGSRSAFEIAVNPPYLMSEHLVCFRHVGRKTAAAFADMFGDV